jgi:hypothetical protein
MIYLITDAYLFEIVISILNAVLLLQVAVLFTSQYRQSQEQLSLLIAICFWALYGSSIFYFLRFFILNEFIFYRLEVALRFTSFTTFVYLFEHKIKKHRFPILVLYCIVSILLILFLPESLAYNAGYTIYLASLFVYWFYVKVYQMTEGTIHNNIRLALIGTVLFGLGIGLSADAVVSSIGMYFIVIGILNEILGVILIGVGFYRIKSSDELTWYREPVGLFIIFNSLCLYGYNFKDKIVFENADLHGGGLAAVLIVSQSIIKSDSPPKHIEFQNTHYLIGLGKREFNNNRLTAVFIVQKNLIILHEKLIRFLTAFEEKFSHILSNWQGDISKITADCQDLMQIFQIEGSGLP